MAEGGNISRTMDGGSDVLFDHECTQCRVHGSTQEATDLCQDCNQLLCNMCGRYHLRNMTTHTLVSVVSLKQSKTTLPTVNPVQIVAKCHYHPDRDIEMYCGTHDLVYCSLCVAKEHRACINVQEIKEGAHKSNLSTLQSLVTDITKVIKRLHDTKMEKSNDLKLLKKRKAALLQQINAVRKRLNSHLDALEQKLIAELDAEENELEKKINTEMNVADHLITASDKRKPDLTSDNDETQMFTIEKLARVVLTEADSYLKNANLSKHATLKFELNNELYDDIEKSDNMGKITNYTVKSAKEISVRIKSDISVCNINDMCQLPDGTILLNDFGNQKLKRLDDQINVKDTLTWKTAPCGLCSVSATEVAVRLSDNTIHFVSVGKSLSYQRKVSINNENICKTSGLLCCNNQLWISGNDGIIYVYALSGSLEKEIETDAQGREIFPARNPQHLAVSNDGTKVYAAAWEDRVVVFSNNGDVITELGDQRLDGTCSVCITDDDMVLVVGNKSNNIVMFDRDDNSLGELVTSTEMLSKPWPLCYDKRRGCLVVCYYLSDKVHVFQLT